MLQVVLQSWRRAIEVRSYLVSIETIAHVAEKHRRKVMGPNGRFEHLHFSIVVHCRKEELPSLNIHSTVMRAEDIAVLN